ncbi:MAG TPA: DUF2231 domain-containing protein [Acidothermaceae bacterium]|jgi:hypothetical protein|nr:DUF2231 domain-containing protein [Acidothermaceae bacterium]
MPATIHGSPTHVLIVHIVVVLLPLSVLAALLLVAVPATRRAYSIITLGVAFIACVAVPLAFRTGSELRARLPPSQLISRHVQLAHQLLPLAAAFGVALAAFVVLDVLQRARTGRLNVLERRAVDAAPTVRHYAENHRLVGPTRTAAALVVVLAILTGVQVYRVGDAGAKAAWAGRLSNSAAHAAH